VGVALGPDIEEGLDPGFKRRMVRLSGEVEERDESDKRSHYVAMTFTGLALLVYLIFLIIALVTNPKLVLSELGLDLTSPVWMLVSTVIVIIGLLFSILMLYVSFSVIWRVTCELLFRWHKPVYRYFVGKRIPINEEIASHIYSSLSKLTEDEIVTKDAKREITKQISNAMELLSELQFNDVFSEDRKRKIDNIRLVLEALVSGNFEDEPEKLKSFLQYTFTSILEKDLDRIEMKILNDYMNQLGVKDAEVDLSNELIKRIHAIYDKVKSMFEKPVLAIPQLVVALLIGFIVATPVTYILIYAFGLVFGEIDPSICIPVYIMIGLGCAAHPAIRRGKQGHVGSSQSVK
jgi:succinate dehydrogenase hydrophobic anchor subunit